ncbi:MAG: hypothetical protein Q9217_000118 [Psora testacea]
MTEPSQNAGCQKEGMSEPRAQPPHHVCELGKPGPEDTKASRKSVSFYLSFLALNISVFLVSLDATALAVAVPKITSELHGTTLQAFWTNLSFLLAVVITQPIYTNISDVLGRKGPLNVAFILVFVGSIVFAIANSMTVLILGRILQGLGGGGLDVLGEVILADLTTLKERPLYLGLFALPMAGGGICGPIIGAAFSEFADWRWIGWLNLPISALGFLLTLFFLRLRPIEISVRSKLGRLDWIGMLLFTIGSTSFALPLSSASAIYPWSSWRIILPLVVGILVLIGFGYYEGRPSDPIFPYRIFENVTAVMTLIGATIHGILLYSILLYVPLFFQAVLLETPFRSAISALPAGISIVGFSIVSAIAVEMIRRYRWMVVSNWFLAACGIGLWALWGPDLSLGLKYGLQILAGIGIGTLFTILTIPMQASVRDVNDMGIAGGILVSFRLFGGLAGLSICSTIFNSVLRQRLTSLGPLPPSFDALGDIREAVAFIPILRTLDQSSLSTAVVIDAYRQSMMAVFLALAGFGIIGFLTSFFIRELSLEKEELGRQRLEVSTQGALKAEESCT